jgi:transcriptional regulator with XRE-family HTH domain
MHSTRAHALGEFITDAANHTALAAQLPEPSLRKELRQGAGLSREQVSVFLKINPRTFDKIEKGTLVPDGDVLEKLVTMYRVLEGELELITNHKEAAPGESVASRFPTAE